MLMGMDSVGKIEAELSFKMANMGIVAAFLVVAMHGYAMFSMPSPKTASWWFYKLFKESFTDIAVPYFFCASAFFLAGHLPESGWFKREVSKRVWTIVVPFFLWVLIAIPVKFLGFVLQNALTGKHVFAGCDFSVMNFIKGFGFTLDAPNPTALWFLRALFLFVLISPLLFQGIKIGDFIIPFVLFVINYFVMPLGLFNSGMNRFLGFFFSINGLAWFAFGAWLRIKPKTSWHTLCEYPISSWVVLCVMVIMRMGCFFADLPYQNLIDKIIVPIALFAVWNIIPLCELPRWLTAAAFPVYLLHPFLFYFVYGGMVALHSEQLVAKSISVYLLVVTFVFSLSVIISALMRRFVPTVARVLFGGRM